MIRENEGSLGKMLLQLQSVSKRFDSVSDNGGLEVLSNVNLQIVRGESLAIVGPSGSGKSTLLNIIGTLDRPSSGQVLLDGRDLSNLNEEELAMIRNEQIGLIFQAHHLLPQCSVLENVLVPVLAQSDRKARSAAAPRARQLLERVGLGQRLDHRPGQLSGGERQRVAVVRALINQPKLLLADEPTGALDRHSAQELGKLLIELNRERHVTLIVVTHAMDLARGMGRVLELRDGRLGEFTTETQRTQR
jgi:lipoprotein-releasing system ATP-binding protein